MSSCDRSGVPEQDLISQTQYDVAGNAIAATDALSRTTRTYYDGVNRMTQTVRNLTNWNITNPQPPTWNGANPDQNVPMQGGTGESATRPHYDVAGRVQQATDATGLTTNFAYDPANRLTAVNSTTYRWDNNGNLLNDGTSAYTYDSQNRLKTLTQGGHSYGFSYNGTGDRLTQSVDGVVTTKRRTRSVG